MSSRIKKKKPACGFNTAEMQRFKQDNSLYSSESKMLKETFKHLQFMGYMALCDRYDFKKDRIVDFYNKVRNTFDDYEADNLSSKDLLTWCVDNGVNAYAWIKSITQTEKLRLSDYAKYRSNVPRAMKVIDSSLLVYAMIAGRVLVEDFSFESSAISEFYSHLSYYIDSYVRGYMDDRMVASILLDELDLDIYAEG